MNLRPLHNYLLLDPEDRKLSTTLIVIHKPGRNEGGIIGTVKAVGPGKFYDGVYTASEAKVGDRVLVVDSHEHKKVGDYLLCQDMDVAAVLEA